MPTANNIWKLLVVLVTSATLVNCATTGPVTEVDPCIEIPFVDGAEGACTNTVTHKAYLVNAVDWAKIRPTMIMIRASHWTRIKKDWLKACRAMVNDNKKCNVAVDSVDKAVTQLDKLLKDLMPDM